MVLPIDIGDNPQLQARRFLETVQHPLCGAIRYPRPAIAPLPGRPHFVDHPAPMLGQHNAEILCGTMGVSRDELRQLEADGVIGSRPVQP